MNAVTEFEIGQGGLVLTSSQEDALWTILSCMDEGKTLISLNGRAGTGKTTSMAALVEELHGRGIYGVEVVTPTNKAATVLRSKGVPANTLFARFFTLVEVSKRPKKMVFTPNYKMVDKLADDKLAYARVVIVDEASMLTKWALDHLARMCDTLILVGDGNQLPPVGDKDVPRGLFCTRQHDATLTEVLRNDGAVLKLADAVRTSRDGRDLAGIVLDAYCPADDFEMLLVLDRPQLICWRNVIRKAVNARARRTLGFEGVLPMPGDLMICRDNSDDVLLNGTQATMLDFSWDKRNRLANIVLDVAGCEGDHSAQMDMFRFFQDQLPAHCRAYADLIEHYSHYDDDEGAALTFGYAITAHSSQGGEWPIVAVVDERAALHGMSAKQVREDPRQMPADDACRRWFYTAVTRARETIYVVDERWTKY